MKKFSDFLSDQFELRKRKNSSYSLRAFARDVEVSPSTLSKILNGKLEPTFDIILKLIQALGLSKLQETRALAQFSTGKKPVQDVEKDYQKYTPEANLEQDSWEYSAILESFNLDTPPVSVLEISRATGIASASVDVRVRVLEKLGLVTRTQKGWRPANRKNITSTDKQESVRKVIREYFEQAMVSMHEDPKEARRIAGMTAAIDPDRLPEAFEMMHEFYLQLIEFLTAGKRKEIYRINLSLAPVKRK